MIKSKFKENISVFQINLILENFSYAVILSENFKSFDLKLGKIF